MPLPFTNRIVCTEDLDYILSPNNDGILDVYRISTGNRQIIENRYLKGKPNVIKRSNNGKWLITGSYHGEFQIYSIEKDL